jgi:hypothetical protein
MRFSDSLEVRTGAARHRPCVTPPAMAPSPAHRPRLNAARRAASPNGSGPDLMTLAGVTRPATRSLGDPARLSRVLVGFGPRCQDQDIELAREMASPVRRRFDPVSDRGRPAPRRSGATFGRSGPLNAVNAAVNQMDQVTPYNGDVAEASTTAMHPARQETENLVRLNSNVRKAGSKPVVTARGPAPSAGQEFWKEGAGHEL